MNFYIKQNSTMPLLKFPLTQKLMEKYGITADMLEGVAVTFSMINIETGNYKIANVTSNLVICPDRATNPSEEYYTLTHMFKLGDTNKPGRYSGEFCLDFLCEGCGKLKLPTESEINIIISGSITKTSVV
jgi:hypothetical protein